ncbi:hypothetical protein SEA_WATERT_59 [Microbacterium phage WaterT]|nr:hypothetical protein SEA_WATERT_59 [Microbacterium phage WaterT]
MTDWTRNDSIALGQIAMQAGLFPDEAERAVMLGARLIAHGFSGYDIDKMIEHYYANQLRGKL